MEQLFTRLTQAVEAGSAPALVAAFIWGILSVVLSPCHLAGIPLIVGFVNGQSPVTTRRALALSSLFALGILVTIALIGVLTAAAGRLLGSVGPWVNYAVAGVFFLIGLHLLGVIPLPWSGPGQIQFQRRGPVAALVLGLVFGVALGPCTFAYMAPVLGVAFKVADSRPVFANFLLTLYGLGHCLVIVGAGTCTQMVQRYLDWNERSRGSAILRSACGVLVLAGGVYLVYTAPQGVRQGAPSIPITRPAGPATTG
jgi:cytochrome c-type biogenesis protein